MQKGPFAAELFNSIIHEVSKRRTILSDIAILLSKPKQMAFTNHFSQAEEKEMIDAMQDLLIKYE